MWARYDGRVEALLDMGAARVVESLLRVAACMPAMPDCANTIIAQARYHCQEHSGFAGVSARLHLCTVPANMSVGSVHH